MTTVTHTQTLVTVECVCGIAYAIPAELHKSALRDKSKHTLWCPLGHQWHYSGKTDAEKLQAAEAQLVAARDQLDAERKAHARTRKRVANGVCPCCHRSFVNVKRHMENKHPDYAG